MSTKKGSKATEEVVNEEVVTIARGESTDTSFGIEDRTYFFNEEGEAVILASDLALIPEEYTEVK